MRLSVLFLALACLESSAHESGQSAIARVSAQILQHPDQAKPHVKRASLYLEAGDWVACLADLERAERLHQTGLHRMRAQALLLGRHERHAIALLNTCSEDAEALWIRAQAHAALGDAHAAAMDCHRALKRLSKPEPDLYLQCAEFYCREGEVEKALSVLDEGPTIAAIIQKAISLETCLGRIDRALQRLETLMVTSSIPEPLMAQQASLLAQAGHVDESMKVWKKLIQRLLAMPPQMRGSHAMSRLLRQSTQAISALRNTVSTQHP